jgi:hypothetical protein
LGGFPVEQRVHQSQHCRVIGVLGHHYCLPIDRGGCVGDRRACAQRADAPACRRYPGESHETNKRAGAAGREKQDYVDGAFVQVALRRL